MCVEVSRSKTDNKAEETRELFKKIKDIPSPSQRGGEGSDKTARI